MTRIRAPALRRRARTCSRAGEEDQHASTTSSAGEPGAGAAVAGRAHRTFGDVEPDEQAQPAIGVEAHPGEAGQGEDAAAGP